MLEISPIARIVKELRSSRVELLGTRSPALGKSQTRSLSHARRRLVQHQRQHTSTNETQQPKAPPPPSDYVPKAADLAQYAAQVASRSNFMRGTTEPYRAFAASKRLWAKVAAQADYEVPNVLKKPSEPATKNDAGEDIGEGTGLWFAPKERGGLELPVTFMTWAQIMFLYMYILNVNLRRLPAEHVRTWQQQLLDFFFQEAEMKMEKWHGMAARGTRNKNLKDLWQAWRGVILSYDEGLVKNDAVLAAAVWRSVFRGSVDANVADIAQVTAYLRRELQKLDVAGIEEMSDGVVNFGQLTDVAKDIAVHSPSMLEPFTAADVIQHDQ